MIDFEGTYFDGKSSRDQAVSVQFDGRRLHIRGEAVSETRMIEECEISPVLGKTRRIFKLPGGARLETDNLQAVAKLEQFIGRNQGMTLVSRLEGRWHWVIFSLVGLVVFTWAFITFGIPYIAQAAAKATPVSVLGAMSDQTLKILDDQYFAPTQLSMARQKEIEAEFQEITRQIGGNYPYRLELRSSPQLGANALALPSGIVVVTDELVKLAKSDRELIGVIAHEVGHVINRHGARSLYQSAGVVLMISLLLGDVTSVTSLAASLPAILIQSGYSRDFERQADEVAGRYLISKNWGTAPLQDILVRLNGNKDATSFLSSHPGTAERVKNLKALESKP